MVLLILNSIRAVACSNCTRFATSRKEVVPLTCVDIMISLYLIVWQKIHFETHIVKLK